MTFVGCFAFWSAFGSRHIFPPFLYCRSISSIRGELVPYLVRKQFSKTTNSQKIKDDVEDQNQKNNDGSTNHGQCLQ